MVDRQTRLTGTQTSFDFETFRSRRSFTNLFEDAVGLRCVTYCNSPDLLLELFEEFELAEMEVIVGDADDYRESLVDMPEVADRLERLKEAEELRIYTCPNKVVHSKLYEIEYANGALTLLVGSPNLTRTGWHNQTNACAVFDTDPGSDVHERFQVMYDDHKERYAELFLEDLTEELETAEDERAAVIERWVEGRTTEKSELEEVHGNLTEKLVEASDRTGEDDLVVVDGAVVPGETNSSDPQTTGTRSSGDVDSMERELVISLKGFSDKGKERAEEQFSDFGTVSSDELRITPSSYGRQLKTVYGIPKMYVDVEQRQLVLTAGEGPTPIGRSPPEDVDSVDEALAHLESYFTTVDDHAKTNRPLAMKTHMFEALLYFFWAPFSNLHADHLQQNNLQLDKRLRYLFLYGESNSGKGTFTKFATSLISDGQVTGSLDADEFGKRRVRAIREVDTTFPMVIDDIKKSKIRQTDTLRNYWNDWSPEHSFPSLVFISNDTKPDEWFRNRAKLIHFDGQFSANIEGEAVVNQLIEESNPVYHWFTRLYLDRDLQLDDDILAQARSVLLDLYDRAEREVPEYFPKRPAEEIYDMGRKRWQQAYYDGKLTLHEDDDRLQIDFANDMESYEILRFKRDLPESVRAEKYGGALEIKTPSQFESWLKGSDHEQEIHTTSSGLLARFRSIFR